MLDVSSRSIRTFTGKYIDVFNPNLDDLDYIDIAHSLSMQCRFGGHTINFYSVAQHSVWVANQLPIEHKLAGLFHDASEGFLVDIPKPIKRELKQYQEIEDNLMYALSTKFKFQYPFDPIIKIADHAALLYEWNNKVLLDNTPEENWNPTRAKNEFIKMYTEILNLEVLKTHI